MTRLRSRVPRGAAGRRLGVWLARRFTYLDEAAWRAEIEAGRVLRNGARTDPDAVLVEADEIEYAPPEAPAGSAPSVPAPSVPIVLDDPAFVVVDKPAHLVSHRRSAFPANAFVPALERRLRCALEPVHRLDRETSGLLLLAKTREAAAALQQQFERGTVQKGYVALVRGRVPDEPFTIDAAIGRDRSSAVRDRRAVVADGTPGARPARTHVRLVRSLPGHSFIQLEPETGRTHQIRVHLAHRGHPLVGDKLYGRSDEAYLAWVDHLRRGGDPRDRPRLMLHAAALSFAHPRDGRPIALRRDPPADMQAACVELAAS